MFLSLLGLGIFAFCMIQSMKTNHRWEEAATKAMQTTEVVRRQRDLYAHTLKSFIEKDRVYYLTHPNKEIRESARAILDNTFSDRVPMDATRPSRVLRRKKAGIK